MTSGAGWLCHACAIALALGGLALPLRAASAGDDVLATLVTVDDTQLEQMRGGFEVDGGLKLSFGIERVSYVNGVLVSAQTLNVPNLQVASGGLLSEALAKAGGMGLIQNGSGNSFTLNTNAVLNGNVIQNTVDNQKILTKTVINSTVNSLQLLRSINLQSAVQDGIVGSLRR